MVAWRLAREEKLSEEQKMSDIPKSPIHIARSLIAQFVEEQAQATRISALVDVNANALVAYAYDMAKIRGTTILHELSRIEQKAKEGQL